MPRPKFFRDPIHLQIRFDRQDGCHLDEEPKGPSILQRIIDTPEFQRLRFIRQNGLANLVFHGAEHSRFPHSVGVMHVARTMYERIARNMPEPEDRERKLEVQIAALVHDVGHGAFSHALEEILKEQNIVFHHDVMTQKFITDPESGINAIITKYDNDMPNRLIAFFDKRLRGKEH
ncbi:MAG: HD domain-containing protein [Roseiarcus sp.]